MTTLANYFHTIRYLRPIQLVGRARLHWRHASPDTRAAPAVRRRREGYLAPVARPASLVAPDVFRFLNEERCCATTAGWSPAGAARLWIYNLHYFDDLNASGADTRSAWHERLLLRWTQENPPGRGDAWDPYPVSRRITNWVKWAMRGNELPAPCVASLAVQARWLAPRLEYHLLANHLLTNAKALIHAGLYFEGPEAERWLARGVRILERQLPEQVLPDGGHFERSPMYHAAVLEDLLDLVNLRRAFAQVPLPALEAAIAPMRVWLRTMSHPDGDIAFFNDAALGEAPSCATLEDYARRLHLGETPDAQPPLVVLAESGYLRARAGPACLLCDCGAVGPDYQPGHAHAETLSCELSLFGQRVLVNSGTSQYAAGAERLRQRGTAAHNTVVVDGMNSSEVWDAFRVARRARARLHATRATDSGALIEASHDGYRRLPGRNEHLRRWLLDAAKLRIEDHISGRFRDAAAHFHLHPEIRARRMSASEVSLTLPAGRAASMRFEGAASVEVLAGTWHPQFGVTVPNQQILARFADASLATQLTWGVPP